MLLDRKVDKEYAGIMGYDFFRKEAYKLAFGEDQNFKENCVRDKLLLEYSIPSLRSSHGGVQVV